MSQPFPAGLLRHVALIVAALSAVGAATGVAAASLAGQGGDAPDDGVVEISTTSRTEVLERTHCGGGTVDAVTRPVPASGAAAVTFVVPPTALVHVDELGQIVAVATNTGCAPRAEDDVYLVPPVGDIVPAPEGFVADRTWTGDFRLPGALVPQAGG